MGQTSSKPASGSNIVATGLSTYINDKGETVTDTFHHYNGETIRQTETGQLPPGGGGLISHQSLYTPWVAVVLVATIFFIISTAMVAMAKQRQRKKPTLNSSTEEKFHSVPLYSLNKSRSHQHASGAKWNIDLLDEVDLES